jgi:diaminopimelate decarboxylase
VIGELVAAHGSPLWLVDLDRVRERLREFRATWQAEWPDVAVAYSYKTNRLPAILHAIAAEGAGHEVVCAAEYALARDLVGADGPAVIVNGPAKPAALLERAARDGALVIVDSTAEIERAAAAGVERVGVRVALAGVGVGATRFGIRAREVPAAARTARALGLSVEVVSGHVVSTGLRRPLGDGVHLAESVTVQWPPSPARHARAAAVLGALAREVAVDVVDLGGGHPAGPALALHAGAAADALRAAGFAGRLLLEPGRAIVADAVDLALGVVAVKRLEDGTRCVLVDGGTNLLPGALWAWPRIEPATGVGGPRAATLVSGPLCLNVDVLSPDASLPEVRPGDLLVARDVGAYQQAQSTQFGDLRPAVVAREAGRWRLVARGESIDDINAGDLAASAVPGVWKESDS